jgi:hypothetical protein
VEFNGLFYASNREGGWFWGGALTQPGNYWRPVTQFNTAHTYNRWDVGGWDTPTTHRYRCYTWENINGTQTRVFWFLNSVPSGNFASGATLGAPHDNHPHWRRHQFSVNEQFVASQVGNNLRLWQRQRIPTATDPLLEPSESRPRDWRRVTFGTRAPFVYLVDENGTRSFYRNELTLDENDEKPGASAHWQKIQNYRTGVEFVFTENAGAIRFWRSPTQSPLRPIDGVGAWQSMTPPPTPPSRYVFRNLGGATAYFDTAGASRLNPAWIGGGTRMRNHWDEFNRYNSGDVVVDGITMTGTYRYFRLRAGAGAQHVGIPPSTPAGRMFWDAIIVLDTSVWG